MLFSIILSTLALDMVSFKDYSYAIVDRQVPYTVTVDCGRAPLAAEVCPHSKGITPVVDGKQVSFTVSEYGQYELLADGVRYFVFADAPQEKVEGRSIMSYRKVDPKGVKDITQIVQKAINETAGKGETLVFPEGTYLCRQISLPSNTHIHLEKGAVILANPSSFEDFDAGDNVKTKRFINIKDADNVKITGQGAINGNGRALREQFGDKARMRLVMAIASTDILVEGVMLQDPGSWNTQILRCENVIFRNVKIMNDYDLSNTDGFDPDASKNVLLENSFAMCSDDNVAMKTTGYSGYGGSLRDVTVRGCVFITKKSSLKLGTETKGNEMRNILFENNDVLEFDRGMAIYIEDGTRMCDVRYVDNRFERYSVNVSYDNGQKDKYKVKGKVTGFEFVVKRRKENSRLGSLSGLTVENCSFESPFLKNATVQAEPGAGFQLFVKNLVISGRKVSNVTEADIVEKGAEVVFEQ